jgi:hypothetical protein
MEEHLRKKIADLEVLPPFSFKVPRFSAKIKGVSA